MIFLLGGPGSGKGTQRKLSSEQRGLAHLSVSEGLRAEIVKAGSTYGPLTTTCALVGSDPGGLLSTS